MTRPRPRSVALSILGAIAVALLVDRIALYLWAVSVMHQFQHYRSVVQSAQSASGPAISLMEMTEPPVWIASARPPNMPPRNAFEACNYMLSLEPSLARPSVISVKGLELSLTYMPPAAAWTTRIFPLRPHGLPYRYYRPQDYYAFEISADFSSPNGLPAFRLYRVTNDERREVPPETRLPEWFP
jgi:hypothetical protein